jgi:cytochrome b6-f complex iron-sulfur subunit
MSAILDFLKSVAGICETSRLGEQLWQTEGTTVRVRVDEAMELQEPLGAVYLKGKGLKRPILIVRDQEGELRCFLNRCTHAGRKLDPVPGEAALRCCSISHSTFDLDGRKLGGPAKGPIRVLQSDLSNGELVINLA